MFQNAFYETEKTHEGSQDGLTIFLEDPRNRVRICHTSIHQLRAYNGIGQSQGHRSLSASLKSKVKK